MYIKMLNLYYLFWGMWLGKYCIEILLHGVGLFAIYLYQKKKSKSNFNIFKLAETLIAICGIVKKIYMETTIMPTLRNRISRVIHNISIYELVLMMYILTLDRMICVINPLKYKLRMTRTKIKIIILISWIISITLGVFIETIP